MHRRFVQADTIIYLLLLTIWLYNEVIDMKIINILDPVDLFVETGVSPPLI